MAVKAGFIGLGTMGLPMAKNILKANGQLLVADLVDAPKEEMKSLGADVAVDNDQVCAECDVIFTSLPNHKVVEPVLNSLIENGRAGQYIVDTSTNTYRMCQELKEKADAKGIHYVDSPISGGAARALAGDLSVMTGATEEEMEKSGVKPLLESIAREVHYTGKTGNGLALKILNNMLSKSILYADAEAILMADHLGIPFEVFYNVIQSSSSQNEIFRIKKEHIQNNEYGKSNKSYSPITMSLKDLKAARELSDDLGIANFGCNNCIQWYEMGMQRGYEEQDSSSIVGLLRELQPAKKND